MKKYNLERHDFSNDNSLRAWSAADELLISHFTDLEKKSLQIAIYHDRFGYLGIQLHDQNPLLIMTHKSQEKAIKLNLENNKLDPLKTSDPIAPIEIEINFALLRVPKSLGLFRLFLEHICHNSTSDITIMCGFMTRHFTPQLLSIAAEYFEEVDQSKAVKKARLLTLSKKKKTEKKELINTVSYNEEEYRQYLGVFSADHIDYATQFFLEHIEINQNDKSVLDLASGNGVIGKEISKQIPDSEIHLMDDSFLAVASAELNIKGENIHHHYDNSLSTFEEDTFDLIVSNPPFHFEYEINIQVPIALFGECARCLKKGGNLQIVASKHLNYKVHLDKIFSSVTVLQDDKKFVVYKCVK